MKKKDKNYTSSDLFLHIKSTRSIVFELSNVLKLASIYILNYSRSNKFDS